MIQELTISGTTPATTVQGAWSQALVGPTTVSVYGDWGAATALAIVYAPVKQGEIDDVARPPAGATNQAFPALKTVAPADVEKVFQVEPADVNYRLALVPTGNDAATDLKVVLAN